MKKNIVCLAAAIGLSVVSGAAHAQSINEDIKLAASDAAVGDVFGVSIAISNGIVAVGAHSSDDQGTSSGSAYLFDASTGAQIAKLTASDAAAGDEFGFSIAISNGIVAVGAFGNDDRGNDSGSAYLFDASTGMQIAKLTANDAETSDVFGYSIAISNGIVTVGAVGDNIFSGSAYVFDVACPAEMNNDFALNFFDISAFLGLFAAGDLAVDFNNDGVLNFFDITIFIVDFGRGCPLSN